MFCIGEQNEFILTVNIAYTNFKFGDDYVIRPLWQRLRKKY